MSLDTRIAELVEHGDPVTIGSVGGWEAISVEDAASPLFPYLAQAIVTAWPSLEKDPRSQAAVLVTAAISTTPSALALADICRSLVPAAGELGLATTIKGALRMRVADRDNRKDAAIAAVALRWLSDLAVLTDGARGALIDALSEVALDQPEHSQFASSASQVASIAHDHWGDSVALASLRRIAETSSDADAWFGLGKAAVASSLQAEDRDELVEQMRSAVDYFDRATAEGEGRSDAALYAHSLRFVIAWANGANVEMLADNYQAARTALNNYVLDGAGIAERSFWLRPRYEAETAWIELLHVMEHAVSASTSETPWHTASKAIGALADLHAVAASFYPASSHKDGSVQDLSLLVSPQLAAPFIRRSERLGYLASWLEQAGDDPDAEAFSLLIQDAVADEVMRPKVNRPGRTRS